MAQPNCWNDRKDHLNQLKFQKDCEKKKTKLISKNKPNKRYAPIYSSVTWSNHAMASSKPKAQTDHSNSPAFVECMDNAEQDATTLKGRLHEIGSAGGEFSGNKKISWRFREVDFRNRQIL